MSEHQRASFSVAHRSALRYTFPMTKTQPKGVRFTDEQHEALQAAAKADMRPVSSLI